jgi:hypothetical protein
MVFFKYEKILIKIITLFVAEKSVSFAYDSFLSNFKKMLKFLCTRQKLT